MAMTMMFIHVAHLFAAERNDSSESNIKYESLLYKGSKNFKMDAPVEISGFSFILMVGLWVS
jgi:hypothetical protein